VSAFWWLLIVGVWGILCSLYGDREGKKRGYELGWKACEEWIVKAESDVDQERQKIWKGEGEQRWP